MTAHLIKVQFAKLLYIAPLAAIASAVVNSILFYLFIQQGWIDQNILVHRERLEVSHIIMASVAPSLLAGVVFAIIGKFFQSPFQVFAYVTIPLLLFTFINPFAGIIGITLSMGIALNVMHITVALFVLYLFKRYATQAEPGY